MTSWSYDPDVDAADIDLAGKGTPIAYPIRCVDLEHARVILDVDDTGRVVSIEVLGPVMDDHGNFIPITQTNLGACLKEEPNQ